MASQHDGLASPQADKGIFDGPSFDGFYRREGAKLRQFLKRRIWAEEDRNDLVQEAFARLIASPSAWARENPGAFLQGIVRHLLADRVRGWVKARTLEAAPIDVVAQPPGPDVAAEISDMRERYRAAVDTLPPRTKEVYLLHRVDELGYRQIADQLGISIRTVEWHLAQAIVRITKSVGRDV